MSSNVGVEANFVDTQGLTLENVTDELIYDQVLTLDAIDILHSVKFHQLTNDTVEKTFGLTDAGFEIVMMITQPEINALFNLTIPVLAKLPIKEWAVRLTDQSNRTTLLEGDAVLKNFKILDSGIGSVQLSIRLEFITKQTVGAVIF